MKRIISAMILICLSFSLVSCHGARERTAFTVPESFDENGKYEISFWAKNDTNQTQIDIYKKAISDFNAIYPNITVNLRLYNDYGKIYQDVITNIATNTTPNVCITYPDHIATYLTGEDTVVALDELLTHPIYGLGGSAVKFDAPGKDEIVPKFLEECRFNEHYYAIPYMRSTEACYVNKTYIEKLGYTLPETLTWDFVWEVSEAAMKKDENGNYALNGQKVLIPFIYKSTDNMMIQMLAQKEAGYSTKDGEVLIFNETTEEILTEIGKHSKSKSFNTFKLIGYPANYLNAGQCIFAVDSTAGATWMGCDAPLIDIDEDNLVEFETVVMPIPQFNPEKPKMISQGPSICIFNREDPQEVVASWLFAQFMLTNSVQIAYSQTEGYAPVTTKAQESKEYTEYLSRSGENNDFYYPVKIAATKLLLDNTKNTFVTPVFNGSMSLRDAAGQLIESVNKSARRGQAVDESYISSLYDEVTSLCRLDQITVTSLGKLPTESALLLSAIGLCWVGMGAYLAYGKIKMKKTKKFRDNP